MDWMYLTLTIHLKFKLTISQGWRLCHKLRSKVKLFTQESTNKETKMDRQMLPICFSPIMSHRILGRDFDWSCYGKNWQSRGYISLLKDQVLKSRAEVPFPNLKSCVLILGGFFSMLTYISPVLPITVLGSY